MGDTHQLTNERKPLTRATNSIAPAPQRPMPANRQLLSTQQVMRSLGQTTTPTRSRGTSAPIQIGRSQGRGNQHQPQQLAITKAIPANMVGSSNLVGWLLKPQAPYDATLELAFGLKIGNKIAGADASIVFRGGIVSDEDRRLRTNLTVGLVVSGQLDVGFFKVAAGVEASYTWAYAFQDVHHLAAHIMKWIGIYSSGYKTYLEKKEKLQPNDPKLRHLKVRQESLGSLYGTLAKIDPISAQRVVTAAQVSIEAGNLAKKKGGASLAKVIAKARKAGVGKWAESILRGAGVAGINGSLQFRYSRATNWFYRSKHGKDGKLDRQVKSGTTTTKTLTLSLGNLGLAVTWLDIDRHANPDQEGSYLQVQVGLGKGSDSRKGAVFFGRQYASRAIGLLMQLQLGLGGKGESVVGGLSRMAEGIWKIFGRQEAKMGTQKGGGVDFVFTFIKSEKGYALQTLRAIASANYAGKIAVPTSVPGLSVTGGFGLSASAALYEMVGNNTLSYVATVFDGFRVRARKNHPADYRFQAPWKKWTRESTNIAALRGIFKNIANKDSNVAAEAAKDFPRVFAIAKVSPNEYQSCLAALEKDLEARFVGDPKSADAKSRAGVRNQDWRSLGDWSNAKVLALTPAQIANLPAPERARVLEQCLQGATTGAYEAVILKVLTAAIADNSLILLVDNVGAYRLASDVDNGNFWNRLAPILRQHYYPRASIVALATTLRSAVNGGAGWEQRLTTDIIESTGDDSNKLFALVQDAGGYGKVMNALGGFSNGKAWQQVKQRLHNMITVSSFGQLVQLEIRFGVYSDPAALAEQARIHRATSREFAEQRRMLKDQPFTATIFAEVWRSLSDGLRESAWTLLEQTSALVIGTQRPTVVRHFVAQHWNRHDFARLMLSVTKDDGAGVRQQVPAGTNAQLVAAFIARCQANDVAGAGDAFGKMLFDDAAKAVLLKRGSEIRRLEQELAHERKQQPQDKARVHVLETRIQHLKRVDEAKGPSLC